ncbi:MAG: hypothetical protein Q8P17_00840 [bacterium]|nr:hypothetical protein [bacterium]
MKKIIIVEHRAKELANCLWNDLSITAFGMSTGVHVINTTLLEHIRFWRYPHMFYARLVDVATRKTCGIWTTGTPKFLPPTALPPKKFETCNTLYFFGWLFRNPVGLERYRDKLLKLFGPHKRMRRIIDAILAPLTGRVLIGLHLKLEPFQGFENGEFLVSPARVQEVVDEYLFEHHLKREDVALIEVSDRGEQKDDLIGLHLLSKCSVVIGDNSTFSNLAAWFGNVPHIVATDEPIDWAYYEDKKQYFENKYATFTHGSLVYP